MQQQAGNQSVLTTRQAARSRWRLGPAIVWIGAATALLRAAPPNRAADLIVRGGERNAMAVVQEIAKAMSGSRPAVGKLIVTCDSSFESLNAFLGGKCHLLVHHQSPEHLWRRSTALRRLKPKGVSLAQAKAAVVVNAANPVEQLSLGQIGEILGSRGKGKKWTDLRVPGGEIRCYGQRKESWGLMIMRRKCMMFRKETKAGHYSGWHPYRHDLQQCSGAEDVISKVRNHRDGIGFLLYDGKPVKGLEAVKILAIGKTDKGPFVKPKLGPYIQEDYPLSEPLILYLHPKAPPLAKKFCEFAVGPEGAKIAAKHGLITPWAQKEAEAAERLKLMKAGKGVPIRGVGSMGGSAVMRDLAVEYVKAEKVVQMACRPATSELTAVGYFVHSKDRELLVLDGPISEQAKKLHGKKWDFLEPETHVLASGRGIAICVNSMNKLGSLTLEQVRHLFSKKTTTWRDVTGAEVKIKRYGLVGKDPAARVFYNRINPPAVCARPETRLGTQAVLAALSRDPHGIAFVDAAAANDLLGAAGGKSGIKVLSIGAKGKAASPTAANVKAGKYPISQQLTLHLSPRASQTTRDFVTYILSGAADEVFTKHGLITPAQARKAAAEAAKKPPGKKRRKR